MKRMLRTTLVLGVLLLLLGVAGWGYFQYKFPYGRTHRCSKILSMQLTQYAHDHGGEFPATDQPGSLGLSVLVEQNPWCLELVVGKAGDLEAAEQFYQAHGFLKAEHSSWHYVSGLTTEDTARAIAWDKIPLGHNGERTRSDSREVIFVDGSVKFIPVAEWQESLDSHSPGEVETE